MQPTLEGIVKDCIAFNPRLFDKIEEIRHNDANMRILTDERFRTFFYELYYFFDFLNLLELYNNYWNFTTMMQTDLNA